MNVKKILGSFRAIPRGAKWLAAATGALVIFWPRKASAANVLRIGPTSPLSYINTSTRDQWYGPIEYIPAPVSGNPEGIRITNDFEANNIVFRSFPLIGRAGIHRLAAPSLEAALLEIQRRGLGDKIRSFAGGYYPRFVRKSTANLSSHSYGTSIDINAGDNPQGSPPTPDQTELAPIFEKHGWYWGDKFKPTRDPMHFEYVLPPDGAVA